MKENPSILDRDMKKVEDIEAWLLGINIFFYNT